MFAFAQGGIRWAPSRLVRVLASQGGEPLGGHHSSSVRIALYASACRRLSVEIAQSDFFGV